MAGHWAPLPLALALALAVPRRVALYCVPIGGRLCSAGQVAWAASPLAAHQLALPDETESDGDKWLCQSPGLEY